MIGLPLFMGGSTTSTRAIVQNAGLAYRLSARHLTQEFSRGGAFQIDLLRFAHSRVTQMTQTAPAGIDLRA